MKMTAKDFIQEKISLVLTILSGSGTVVLDFLDNHAAGIGALCTIVSCVVYVTMSIRNDIRMHKKENEVQE